MYFVYILQSTRDCTYYIGYTQDIFERLKTHNSGKVRYTKGHIPYALVYREQCNNLQDAKAREKAIKSLKNTTYFLKKQMGSPDNQSKWVIGTSPERKAFGGIPLPPL